MRCLTNIGPFQGWGIFSKSTIILLLLFLLWAASAQGLIPVSNQDDLKSWRTLNILSIISHQKSPLEDGSSSGSREKQDLMVPIAIKHFNQRDGRIISEFADQNSCKFKLNLHEYASSEKEDSLEFSTFANLARLFSSLDSNSIDAVLVEPMSTSKDLLNLLSIVTRSSRIPVLFQSKELVDASTLFNMRHSTKHTIQAIADLIVKQFKYRSVGLIHSSNHAGLEFRNSVFKGFDHLGIHVHMSPFFESLPDGTALNQEMNRALRMLVRENVQVIIRFGLSNEQEIALAKAAHQLNWINGRVHVLFTQQLDDLLGVAAAEKEPFTLTKFLHGTIRLVDDFDLSNKAIDSLTSKRALINDALATTSQIKCKPNQICFNNTALVKENNPHSQAAAFAYDSVAAIGLAVCARTESHEDLLIRLKHVRFNGTTGQVAFDDSMQRDLYNNEDVCVHLENILLKPTATRKMSLEAVRIGHYHKRRWTFNQQVVLNNVTTMRPTAQPDDLLGGSFVNAAHKAYLNVLEWPYVSWTVSAAVGIKLLLLLGDDLLHPDDSPFAQRLSFMLIMSGSILMASALIPLTLDTHTTANSSETAWMHPWFFFLGFTFVVLGLMGKLFRAFAIVLSRGLSKMISQIEILRQAGSKWNALIVASGLVLVIALIGLVGYRMASIAGDQIHKVNDSLAFATKTKSLHLFSSSRSTANTLLMASLVCGLLSLPLVYTMVSWCQACRKGRQAPGNRDRGLKVRAFAGFCTIQIFFVGIPTILAIGHSSAGPPLAVWGLLVSIFLISLSMFMRVILPKLAQQQPTISSHVNGINHEGIERRDLAHIEDHRVESTTSGGYRQQRQQHIPSSSSSESLSSQASRSASSNRRRRSAQSSTYATRSVDDEEDVDSRKKKNNSTEDQDSNRPSLKRASDSLRRNNRNHTRWSDLAVRTSNKTTDQLQRSHSVGSSIKNSNGEDSLSLSPSSGLPTKTSNLQKEFEALPLKGASPGANSSTSRAVPAFVDLSALRGSSSNVDATVAESPLTEKDIIMMNQVGAKDWSRWGMSTPPIFPGRPLPSFVNASASTFQQQSVHNGNENKNDRKKVLKTKSHSIDGPLYLDAAPGEHGYHNLNPVDELHALSFHANNHDEMDGEITSTSPASSPQEEDEEVDSPNNQQPPQSFPFSSGLENHQHHLFQSQEHRSEFGPTPPNFRLKSTSSSKYDIFRSRREYGLTPPHFLVHGRQFQEHDDIEEDEDDDEDEEFNLNLATFHRLQGLNNNNISADNHQNNDHYGFMDAEVPNQTMYRADGGATPVAYSMSHVSRRSRYDDHFGDRDQSESNNNQDDDAEESLNADVFAAVVKATMSSSVPNNTTSGTALPSFVEQVNTMEPAKTTMNGDTDGPDPLSTTQSGSLEPGSGIGVTTSNNYPTNGKTLVATNGT